MNTTVPLTNAFEHVEILHKLIPICAWCNRVRDEDGNGRTAEDFFHARPDADFTHSICPTCLEKERRKLNRLGRDPAGKKGPVRFKCCGDSIRVNSERLDAMSYEELSSR